MIVFDYANSVLELNFQIRVVPTFLCFLVMNLLFFGRLFSEHFLRFNIRARLVRILKDTAEQLMHTPIHNHTGSVI